MKQKRRSFQHPGYRSPQRRRLSLFVFLLLLFWGSPALSAGYNIDFSKVPVVGEEGIVGEAASNALWDRSTEDEKKEAIASAIARFREKDGVVIRKSPSFYVAAIDAVRVKDPAARACPLGVVFRAIAVMEYDFDEGIYREETAARWLGDAYQEFAAAQVRGFGWGKMSFDEKKELVQNYITENDLRYGTDDVIEVLDFFYSTEDGLYQPMTLQEVLNRVITCEGHEEASTSASEQQVTE